MKKITPKNYQREFHIHKSYKSIIQASNGKAAGDNGSETVSYTSGASLESLVVPDNEEIVPSAEPILFKAKFDFDPTDVSYGINDLN